ncbi:MAG: sulfotransferase, partial [Nevskiales bacterium]
MKLDTEFIKLPFRFDAARLAEEIAGIPESDWRPHPQGNPGNSALPLIALRGDPLDDGVKGPMRPTPVLAKLPYLRQVIASFGVPLGRTRLMRLIGNAEATAHADINYYWMRRTRIHIPLVTTPEVSFHCGERQLHMAAGECWLFDTWRVHNVFNPAPTMRIHLVVDTVGAPAFWDTVARAERPFGKPVEDPLPLQSVAYEPGLEPQLILEDRNFPVVMSPEEMQDLVGQCLQEMDEVAANPREQAEAVRSFMQQWMAEWAGLWAQHQDRPSGWKGFHALVQKFDAWRAGAPEVRVPNNNFVREFLMHVVTNAALNVQLAEEYAGGDAPAPHIAEAPSRFDRPVFIVSAPRSGSSLLFETLARSPDFWTVGGESHAVFEKIPMFQPEKHNWDSNRLTAEQAVNPAAMRLRDSFIAHLRNREGKFLPADNSPFRMLEKTPKNALRLPLLAAVFPDARFIYLYRQPRDNLSSMLDAWRSGRFVTYPKLPGWTSPEKWSLLLVPGWRDKIGKPLAEAVAHQWQATQQHLLQDLTELPADRWCAVRYEDFLKNPQQVTEQLSAFCGVHWDQALGDT